MKTVVLDTDILIDNVHGFAPWVDKLLDSLDFELVIPTVVIAEYLTAQEVDKSEGEKSSLNYLNLFIKQDLTGEIAQILGIILRRKTYSFGASTADLIIASTALFLDAPLATNNKKDFARIPDLRFFDPQKFK